MLFAKLTLSPLSDQHRAKPSPGVEGEVLTDLSAWRQRDLAAQVRVHPGATFGNHHDHAPAPRVALV